MNNNSDFYKNLPKEKSFGIFFSIIFFLIFLYLFFDSNFQTFNIFIFCLSLILFVISFKKPILLKIPNMIWFHFGFFLGKYTSTILMLLIFFIIMTPIGLLLKIFQIDSLKKKNYKSLWDNNPEKNRKLEKQF